MTHRILAGPSVGPHTFVSLKIYETDQSLILIRFDLQYFSPVHFLFHLAFFYYIHICKDQLQMVK